MKQSEINAFEQKESSRVVLEDHRDIWDNRPAVVLGIADLDNELEHLRETLRAQRDRSKPATNKKREGRKKLKAQTLELGGALLAYADAEGDNALKVSANLVPSKLDRMSGTKFTTLAMDLLILGEGIGGGALTPYGFDHAALIDLRASVEELTALFGGPRYTKAQLAAMQKLVPVHLRKARYILRRKLRNLLFSCQESHPNFWETFEVSLRTINKRGPKREATGSNPDTNQDQDQTKS